MYQGYTLLGSEVDPRIMQAVLAVAAQGSQFTTYHGDNSGTDTLTIADTNH